QWWTLDVPYEDAGRLADNPGRSPVVEPGPRVALQVRADDAVDESAASPGRPRFLLLRLGWPPRRPPMTLLGRRAECEQLDGVLADALAGRSRVVVLRGEAGAGKSALLHYVSERSDGWQVARAVGIESELELAYSGLHQLCAPLLDHVDR